MKNLKPLHTIAKSELHQFKYQSFVDGKIVVVENGNLYFYRESSDDYHRISDQIAKEVLLELLVGSKPNPDNKV